MTDEGRWMDDLASAYYVGEASLHDILAHAYSRGVQHRLESLERYLAEVASGQPVIIKADVSASPEACAVADAWVRNQRDVEPQLGNALAALEAITRNSPLRKVKP